MVYHPPELKVTSEGASTASSRPVPTPAFSLQHLLEAPKLEGMSSGPGPMLLH